MELSQEEYDEIINNQRIAKFQLQELLDMLDGRIRSENMVEYRNTYIENDWGNCDSTYPFIMDFELVDEMTKLVECKVTFKVRNFNIGVKDI